jgi:uncharacterized membrane protein YgcG
MYSTQMTGVFSGGLAYEFTQEPNDYGLVTINGTTAHLLNDFAALQSQYAKVTSVTAGTAQAVTRLTTCPAANSYAHLNGTNILPDTPVADLIKNGIASNLFAPGKLIKPSTWSTNYTIVDQNGKTISNKAIDSSGYIVTNPANGGSGSSGSQVGGGSSGTSGGSSSNSTSDAVGNVRVSGLLAIAAAGVVAWNGIA